MNLSEIRLKNDRNAFTASPDTFKIQGVQCDHWPGIRLYLPTADTFGNWGGDWPGDAERGVVWYSVPAWGRSGRDMKPANQSIPPEQGWKHPCFYWLRLHSAGFSSTLRLFSEGKMRQQNHHHAHTERG